MMKRKACEAQWWTIIIPYMRKDVEAIQASHAEEFWIVLTVHLELYGAFVPMLSDADLNNRVKSRLSSDQFCLKNRLSLSDHVLSILQLHFITADTVNAGLYHSELEELELSVLQCDAVLLDDEAWLRKYSMLDHAMVVDAYGCCVEECLNRPVTDNDDAASAASFEPDRTGSRGLASEKSFDPDHEEREDDLSAFEEKVAPISARPLQRKMMPTAAPNDPAAEWDVVERIMAWLPLSAEVQDEIPVENLLAAMRWIALEPAKPASSRVRAAQPSKQKIEELGEPRAEGKGGNSRGKQHIEPLSNFPADTQIHAHIQKTAHEEQAIGRIEFMMQNTNSAEVEAAAADLMRERTVLVLQMAYRCHLSRRVKECRRDGNFEANVEPIAQGLVEDLVNLHCQDIREAVTGLSRDYSGTSAAVARGSRASERRQQTIVTFVPEDESEHNQLLHRTCHNDDPGWGDGDEDEPHTLPDAAFGFGIVGVELFHPLASPSSKPAATAATAFGPVRALDSSSLRTRTLEAESAEGCTECDEAWSSARRGRMYYVCDACALTHADRESDEGGCYDRLRRMLAGESDPQGNTALARARNRRGVLSKCAACEAEIDVSADVCQECRDVCQVSGDVCRVWGAGCAAPRRCAASEHQERNTQCCRSMLQIILEDEEEELFRLGMRDEEEPFRHHEQAARTQQDAGYWLERERQRERKRDRGAAQDDMDTWWCVSVCVCSLSLVCAVLCGKVLRGTLSQRLPA